MLEQYCFFVCLRLLRLEDDLPESSRGRTEKMVVVPSGYEVGELANKHFFAFLCVRHNLVSARFVREATPLTDRDYRYRLFVCLRLLRLEDDLPESSRGRTEVVGPPLVVLLELFLKVTMVTHQLHTMVTQWLHNNQQLPWLHSSAVGQKTCGSCFKKDPVQM
eukprot:sb/3472680/